MIIMLRSVLPIAALLALSVGTVLAQTAPPPPTPPRPTNPATRPAVGTAPAVPASEGSTQAYRVKQVLGTKVSIKGDLGIGTVDDVVFNDAGQIEYLIVANDGKMVTVPWEAAKFNFEKQTAVLNISQDQYQGIPTYSAREYPVFFEPGYRTRAYGWYGLRPRPWQR
jgi:PRC-barrel domain